MLTNEELLKELNAIPEEVTDWDLCPFCMREDDDNVGDTIDRHEKNCFRKVLLSHISELEAELEKKNKALEKISSGGTACQTRYESCRCRDVAQAALDSNPPFRHSQEV